MSAPAIALIEAPAPPHQIRTAGTNVRTGNLLAIDIGRTGALALFDAAGRLLDIVDMPTLDDGPPAARLSTARCSPS